MGIPHHIYTICLIQKETYHCCVPTKVHLNAFTSSNMVFTTKESDEIKKQMTSGPVNAHLTPGPGIYFNAFTHVYSHRAGADNPLGTNIDVNRKPLSLCPFVASFKTISFEVWF